MEISRALKKINKFNILNDAHGAWKEEMSITPDLKKNLLTML